MASRPGPFRRFFAGLWNLLDFSRRLFFNILFLVIVVVLLFAFATGDRAPRLGPDTALVLNLQGDIVEEHTITAREAAVADALGQPRFETRLRDVVDALEHAAGDSQITRVVLVLDQMGSAGLASLREIGAALERFKKSGKPVIAWGENYSQAQYYLAAHADELLMHPNGIVLLRGLGGPRAYYKGLLDKLGVRVHAFQAGRYKSFGEYFTRTNQSPEAREADTVLLNGLWSTWTADVERVRQLQPGSIDGTIAALPQKLAATGGNLAQLIARERLVDRLATRDEFRNALLDAGAPRSTDDEETFRQIALYSYLRHVRQPVTRDAVGVIVMQGEIVPGDARQGRVGARAAIELLQRARRDDAIKAIVVRVDSPGGAVQASELIREQLDLTRESGKPVVVSMGDVAASGGYWIAMGGDEVFADPATITGSIGVFALVPTVEETMGKVGVTTDGVATTWLAEATDPRRPLDKRLAQVMAQVVAADYQRFLTLVANRRNASVDQVNEVAQGRVWTGAQAKERGLVDRLGGLRDAVEAAAQRADLGDRWRVQYIEHEPRGLARFFSLLLGGSAWMSQQLGWESALQNAFGGDTVPAMRRDLEQLRAMRDQPLKALSYCFCGVR